MDKKSTEFKFIPTTITIKQKLDFSQAVKNPDGSFTLSLSEPHPELTKSKLKDRNFNEPEFVNWLIKAGHMTMLWNEIFPKKNQKIKFGTEIKNPFTNENDKPGDIDILAFQDYNYALGIECKLVKFDYEKQQNNPNNIFRAFNKIKGIDDAWEQLEGYRKLGFYKTYLMIVVLDDQSTNNAPGQLSRKIDNTIVPQFKNLNIDNDTGIIIFSVSQISEYELDIQNIVSMEIIKEANQNEQDRELTKKIIQNKHLFE